MSSSLESFITTMHTRLAAVEGKLGLPSPATAPSLSPATSSEIVTNFDQFVAEKLNPFVATSTQIGGKVESLGKGVENAFGKLRDVLVFASESKKPSGTDFMAPLQEAVSAVQKLRERDEFENHEKACSEGIPALGWVNPANLTPGPFVLEMAEASVFYANKVRKDFKGKEGGDHHVQWCKELDALWKGLGAFVKEYQPTGLTWNPKGKDSAGAAPVATSAPAGAGGESKAAASGSAAVSLFAELSKIDQSSGKTAGLKHVTKDMKSKNIVAPPAEKKVPASSSVKKDEPAPKVQVFALQGNKWVVEGQTGTINIAADQVSVKHSVYIYNCVGATILIEGKCNTITIDGCRKTSVVFQDVLALCEVVNAKGIKLQCKGKAPTVSVDKTDGIVIYLSRDSMYETKIVASKSSEMNVQFPGKTDDDAWIEKVIPEQYVHHIRPDDTISAEVSDLYSHGG
jgi:adenylyl cyclase-associated protein